MHCTKRDQEILLLQHGALSWVERFWLERHIASCPHCEEKQREYARTSLLIAGATRAGSDMPAYALRGGAGVTPVFRPALMAGMATVAALIAAGIYTYNAAASAPMADVASNSLPKLASPFASYPTQENAKDAAGRATIFPYSTPTEPDNCVIEKK